MLFVCGGTFLLFVVGDAFHLILLTLWEVLVLFYFLCKPVGAGDFIQTHTIIMNGIFGETQ